MALTLQVNGTDEEKAMLVSAICWKNNYMAKSYVNRPVEGSPGEIEQVEIDNPQSPSEFAFSIENARFKGIVDEYSEYLARKELQEQEEALRIAIEEKKAKMSINIG